MHALTRLVTPFVVCTAAVAFAQAPAKPEKQDAADVAWLDVTTLATPAPAEKVTARVTSRKITGSINSTNAKKTDTQIQTELKQQGDRFLQASQSAKDFYTKYPKHPKAAAAKKLEASTALQAVQSGATDYMPAALNIGRAYRADKKNPAKDRFDVALTMETLVLSASLHGERLIDNGSAYEKLADALYDELGDTPEIHGFYVNIIHTADLPTSVRVARKLAQMKKAPDSVRNEAQKVLDRNDMIGQKIDLPLTMAEEQTLNLKSLTGQPTVVFVWNAQSGTGDLAALARFRSFIPDAGVRWVYIAVGGLAPRSAKADWKPATEIHCYEPPGLNSPTARSLKLQQTPYVYVLDAQARLTGCGRVEDLPALFKAANP